MTSQHGRTYFQLTGKKTTNLASTNSSTLRAFPILLPPIDEQAKILLEVGKQTSALDTTITSTEREITLLREYRTRLIADVVTGKLDVRAAAARLPDESEEPEAADEAEDLTDADDEPTGDLDEVAEEAAD